MEDFDESEDDIFDLMEENEDEIARFEAIEKAMPAELKFCEQCGESIANFVKAADESETIADHEYIEMMSVVQGEVGRISYICGGCIKHNEISA